MEAPERTVLTILSHCAGGALVGKMTHGRRLLGLWRWDTSLVHSAPTREEALLHAFTPISGLGCTRARTHLARKHDSVRYPGLDSLRRSGAPIIRFLLFDNPIGHCTPGPSVLLRIKVVAVLWQHWEKSPGLLDRVQSNMRIGAPFLFPWTLVKCLFP